MPLQEGQVQIRDLVMGAGTRFRMMNEFNPFGIQIRAAGSGERAWNHGSWSGAEWAQERVVPMRILIIDEVAQNTAGWMLSRHELAAAFRPIGDAVTDVDLRFKLGGVEYLLRGRPRMLEPSTTHIGRGHGFVDAAFVALDPLIYAGTESSVSTGLTAFTGGLTVSVTVPFSVDATQTSGIASLINEGTADTALLLKIDGPVVQPRVTVERADGVVQTLRFNLTLNTGEWLDVDTAAKTVLQNGTVNRRGLTAGDFPTLPTGTHTLRFAAGDYNASALVTARWRNAYW